MQIDLLYYTCHHRILIRFNECYGDYQVIFYTHFHGTYKGQEVVWFELKNYFSNSLDKDNCDLSISIILYFTPHPLLLHLDNVSKLYSRTFFSSKVLFKIRRQSSVRGNIKAITLYKNEITYPSETGYKIKILKRYPPRKRRF